MVTSNYPSFPQKQESILLILWIPACSGMTKRWFLESAKKVFDCASSVQDIGRLAEENIKLNSMINEMCRQGKAGDTWSKACDLSHDILTKIALLASDANMS
jgi:hypothetical protein